MVSGFLSCFELKLSLAELRSATGCLETVLIYAAPFDVPWILEIKIRKHGQVINPKNRLINIPIIFLIRISSL